MDIGSSLTTPNGILRDEFVGVEEREGIALYLRHLREEKARLRRGQPRVRISALKSFGVWVAGGVSESKLMALDTQEMLLMTSLSLPTAARIAGMRRKTAEIRLNEGSLLGIMLPSGHWRVLSFQITQEGEVPGLKSILEAVPDGTNPLVIYDFFISKNNSLLTRAEEPTSPLRWLRAGGDAETVAALAREI